MKVAAANPEPSVVLEVVDRGAHVSLVATLEGEEQEIMRFRVDKIGTEQRPTLICETLKLSPSASHIEQDGHGHMLVRMKA